MKDTENGIINDINTHKHTQRNSYIIMADYDDDDNDDANIYYLLL